MNTTREKKKKKKNLFVYGNLEQAASITAKCLKLSISIKEEFLYTYLLELRLRVGESKTVWRTETNRIREGERDRQTD